jgi:hypothetical protein
MPGRFDGGLYGNHEGPTGAVVPDNRQRVSRVSNRGRSLVEARLPCAVTRPDASGSRGSGLNGIVVPQDSLADPITGPGDRIPYSDTSNPRLQTICPHPGRESLIRATRNPNSSRKIVSRADGRLKRIFRGRSFYRVMTRIRNSLHHAGTKMAKMVKSPRLFLFLPSRLKLVNPTAGETAEFRRRIDRP